MTLDSHVFLTDPCFGSIDALDDSLHQAETHNGGVASMIPWACASDAAGNLYVLDREATIYKLSQQGVLLSSWPLGVGTDSGQLASRAFGIAVDGVGRIYVADTGNNRIEIFDRNGNFLETFGTFGSGPGQFATPAHVAVDASGKIFVTDANNFRVQVFSQTVAVTPASWSGVKQLYR